MFEIRQILTRMRLGDTDRAIARAGLMGRRKLAQLRRAAEAAGWLDVATALPGDPELAAHLGPVRTQPAVASLAEPHRERIERWWRQGIQGASRACATPIPSPLRESCTVCAVEQQGHRSRSRVRQSRMLGSVGAAGGQLPAATRHQKTY